MTLTDCFDPKSVDFRKMSFDHQQKSFDLYIMVGLEGLLLFIYNYSLYNIIIHSILCHKSVFFNAGQIIKLLLITQDLVTPPMSSYEDETGVKLIIIIVRQPGLT